MRESDRPVARYIGEMLDLYFNFYLPSMVGVARRSMTR